MDDVKTKGYPDDRQAAFYLLEQLAISLCPYCPRAWVVEGVLLEYPLFALKTQQPQMFAQSLRVPSHRCWQMNHSVFGCRHIKPLF